jgi:hypothetical protein
MRSIGPEDYDGDLRSVSLTSLVIRAMAASKLLSSKGLAKNMVALESSKGENGGLPRPRLQQLPNLRRIFKSGQDLPPAHLRHPKVEHDTMRHRSLEGLDKFQSARK